MVLDIDYGLNDNPIVTILFFLHSQKEVSKP